MNLHKLELILRYEAVFCRDTDADVLTRAKIVQAAMVYANEFSNPESLSPETIKLIHEKFKIALTPKTHLLVKP